jgi:hypothetical protein
MNISCTARYQLINASPVPGNSGYIAFTSDFNTNVPLTHSNLLINQQLPPLGSAILLVYIVGLDPAEWTPGLVSDAISACAMTITTNII